jgi:hypothetical protein
VLPGARAGATRDRATTTSQGDDSLAEPTVDSRPAIRSSTPAFATDGMISPLASCPLTPTDSTQAATSARSLLASRAWPAHPSVGLPAPTRYRPGTARRGQVAQRAGARAVRGTRARVRAACSPRMACVRDGAGGDLRQGCGPRRARRGRASRDPHCGGLERAGRAQAGWSVQRVQTLYRDVSPDARSTRLLLVRCDSLRGAFPNARTRSKSGSGVPLGVSTDSTVCVNRCIHTRWRPRG